MNVKGCYLIVVEQLAAIINDKHDQLKSGLFLFVLALCSNISNNQEGYTL